jgi:hypothetical protein
MLKSIQAICLLILSAGTVWGQAVAPALDQDTAKPSNRSRRSRCLPRMVAISAVVKSKDGEPKGGLTKDDFVLKQDGNEEPIHYFSQGSELPLTFALMVDTSGSNTVWSLQRIVLT